MFELDNVKNEAVLRDFFIFKLDNIKNEAILQDVLQKFGKLRATLTASY